jgi:hypothetical protein
MFLEGGGRDIRVMGVNIMDVKKEWLFRFFSSHSKAALLRWDAKRFEAYPF